MEAIGKSGVKLGGPALVFAARRAAGDQKNEFVRERETRQRRIEPRKIGRAFFRYVCEPQLGGDEISEMHVWLRRPEARVGAMWRGAGPFRPIRTAKKPIENVLPLLALQIVDPGRLETSNLFDEMIPFIQLPAGGALIDQNR